MPKRLFDHNDFYKDPANEIAEQVERFIEDLFRKYSQYSTRDIASIALDAITMSEVTTRAIRNLENKKERESAREAKGAPLERDAE